MDKKTKEELNKKSLCLHYDKEGVPIGLGDWCERIEDENYKRIGLYENHFINISTVWLGIDHSFGFGKNNKILIFESMIFVWSKKRDVLQHRYSTLQEVQEGHRRLVKRYWWRLDLLFRKYVWR